MTTLVIEAGRTEGHYWKDLWRYRELLVFLSWRDILVRYKQTLIGIMWAVLRPLLTMAVLVLVFSKLARLPSNGVPYPILVFAGLLPWQFFANAFTEAGSSLIANASMISKIYFPRLIIPFSAVVVGFVDFLISIVILAGMMLWYRFAPSWHIVALPLFALLGFAAALGSGLCVAALNVKYRDFRYIVPFVVQLGTYVSPVGFTSSIVPPQWRTLYSLNPLVGIIDGFRWAIIGRGIELNSASLLISVGLTSLLLITGIVYFRKTERTFADVI